MQVKIRGWSRDHGAKALLSAELAYDDVRQGGGRYSWKQTYIDVVRIEREPLRGKPRPPIHKVRVTGSADLNLNGRYMVQLELEANEIARLFYLTHGAEEGRRALASLEGAVSSLRALYGEESAAA